MHEMHEKMLNANIARTALMAEHIEVMQTSMSMLTGMSRSNNKSMMQMMIDSPSF